MVLFTVVGSLNYDLVSYTERVPKAGETFKGDSFETHVGGKGLNQTVSLARQAQAGDAVRMVGKVGGDTFGKDLIDTLKSYDVDVSQVGVLSGVSSGVAVIIVERSTGENRILITPGANGEASYTDEELHQLFTHDKQVVVFQNEIKGTEYTIQWLSKNRPNASIVYNPSPYYSFSSKLTPLDILAKEELSNYETLIADDMVEGYKQLSLKLQPLLNQKNEATIVITLGTYGSLFRSKDSMGFTEAVKVDNVVDTTGAGDTFLGAFVTQLISSRDPHRALKFAALASSLAIQKKGASNSIPSFGEVELLFKS
ncbi:putative ribokinase [Cyberlindnera jadinii NRRL Y-1542]|uniref:Ribokinase n=1 Tax=Cyberlindnera jadinii (strain ATCC 18201 / CBS 1600 / BCRC 20928 / JCM 3617 / NBRC 0987 / NRRL Y-1542) TaxID=983966 RepID=A0A1E4S5I0_CYBJN|nr:Ribokinase-like protein [Cyberlindnera jadinii NRRL Y-1542]ODV74652.1 Ribokinase-like protein [Cyberlindnera jadinii NRRL Y-1542]